MGSNEFNQAPQGIDMLCMQGFTLNRNEPDSELEALRCLANCLLLAPATRAMLVELGFARNVPEQFQVPAM